MSDEIIARFSQDFDTFKLDMDARLPAKGVTAVFGPSGSGKTTFLRMIAGLYRSSSGLCRVGEELWQDDHFFLPPHRRAIGYVFQEASLFAHLSVKDNLLFGALKAEDKHAADLQNVVQLLGLQEFLTRSPQHLSGGERQRVAIGRALLSAPKLLLMDEPLSALDAAAKQNILPFLERLCQNLKVPLIYVSHHMEEIERIADTLILVEKGRIIASGPLAKLQSDPNLPLFSRAGAAASLSATLKSYDETYGLAEFAVAGTSFFVLSAQKPMGPIHRLKILARDVSLTLQPNTQSSILNIVPVVIRYTKAVDAQHMSLILALSEASSAETLLARITRKSWDQLQLVEGQKVFAQIKAVSFEDPRDN